MDKKITVSKISGIPNENGWSQIYEFDDPNQKGGDGNEKLILIIAGGLGDQQIEAVKLGREIALKTKDFYENNLEDEEFESIKNCIKQTYQQYEKKVEDFEMVVALLKGNILYVTLAGGGAVYSYQSGNFFKVLESNGKESSASGKIENQRTVLLASGSVLGEIGEKNLVELLGVLDKGGTESFVDQVSSLIRGRGGGNRTALIVLREAGPMFTDDKKDGESIRQISTSEEKISSKEEIETKDLKANKSPGNLYLKRDKSDEVLTTPRKINKTPLYVGALILIMLVVSIYYGVNKKKESDFKESYTTILQEALHNVSEASSIYALDKAKSRQLFADSMEKLEVLKSKNVPEDEISPLTNAIEEGRNKILGEFEGNPEIFLDTTLLSQGFRGNLLSYSSDEIYVADTNSKKIVQVGVTSKRSSVVLGSGKLREIVDISSYGKTVYVMGENGVYEVSGESEIKRTNEGDLFFRTFAYQGNLYVVDTKSGKIWKYVGKENGFSEPVLWNSEETDLDLEGYANWSIDGSIWILKDNGELLRLVQGKRINFNLSGIVPELKHADSLYTDSSIRSLYILDGYEKRLAIFDKEKGEYTAQYSLEGIDSPVSVVVSENTKKAIILGGDGKLYSVELKHLE